MSSWCLARENAFKPHSHAGLYTYNRCGGKWQGRGEGLPQVTEEDKCVGGKPWALSGQGPVSQKAWASIVPGHTLQELRLCSPASSRLSPYHPAPAGAPNCTPLPPRELVVKWSQQENKGCFAGEEAPRGWGSDSPGLRARPTQRGSGGLGLAAAQCPGRRPQPPGGKDSPTQPQDLACIQPKGSWGQLNAQAVLGHHPGTVAAGHSHWPSRALGSQLWTGAPCFPGKIKATPKQGPALSASFPGCL